MTRSTLSLWLGVATLASGLAAGCSHTQAHRTACPRCGQMARLRAEPTDRITAVAMTGPGPEVVIVPQDSAEPAVASADRVPRRSYADITASPMFAHAPDYGWVQGELQYVHAHKAWRIRYAPVDEEDRFGGGLWLANPAQVNGYKEGQIVRIGGRVVDAEARDPSFMADSVVLASPEATAVRTVSAP